MPKTPLEERKAYVLERLEEGDSFVAIAELLGLTTAAITNWRRNDAIFDAECRRCMEIGKAKSPPIRRPGNTRGRPITQISDHAAEQLLGALRAGKSRSGACADAGVPFGAFKHRMEWDEEFAADVEEAEEGGADQLEDEAYRRAHDGVTRIHVTKNGDMFEEQVYSDRLLEFLLTGRKRNRYGRQIAHTGPGGGPIKALTLSLTMDPVEASRAYADMIAGKEEE